MRGLISAPGAGPTLTLNGTLGRSYHLCESAWSIEHKSVRSGSNPLADKEEPWHAPW